MATKNVLECAWCDGKVHSECVGLSEDQCNILDGVTINIVFFCSTCLQLLPAALKCYDSLSLVDSRVVAVENSVSEI